MQPMSANQMVRNLKNQDQDFEWYPTTDAMIECVKTDIRAKLKLFRDDPVNTISVLDCGAGDGRVLQALTNGDRFAIEKSQLLVEAQDASVITVGTDLMQQALIDKRVDVIFSNPPYSEFSAWTRKIVSEANAKLVYLVIPDRWVKDAGFAEILKSRKANAKVIGSFDFGSPDAERRARARVNILSIQLAHEGSMYHNSRSHGLKTDPFDQWFNDNFAPNANRTSFDNLNPADAIKNQVKERVKHGQELVTSNGLVQALEQFYHEDLEQLLGDYQRICALDSVMLYEMGVNTESLAKALKLKITGLKDAYWQELFSHLGTVTSRLTRNTRKTMLDKLNDSTHIDFSAANAHALLSWVIKNCNNYFDAQLIALVKQMTHQANVIKYKSNERVFSAEDWRYGRKPEIERYGLDYRIVLELYQAICVSEFSFEHTKSGLGDYAASLLDDIATVANNIGFDTTGQKKAHDFEWTTGKKVNFMFLDHRTGQEAVLFEAKAFKKGTVHLKMNQRFACKLNTEFGRLMGWLRNAEHANKEMDIPLDVANEAFGSNLQLTAKHVALLAGPETNEELREAA
ncbi:class I SAM-dependent methyltransferase [Marinobacter sp. F3R08]|uniref:class I SAM-dependent methyltransferase n=1 Tax=Marinobacter sp. F3R08 TaxID=2841559 RepID=UPI001C0976F4|nr:DUF4942 domain-containing protein [Marinobacter sp. F3R08]MBU2952196.1 DUF4942 domain-containing protein [Marinobacter sp. F3R08]